MTLPELSEFKTRLPGKSQDELTRMRSNAEDKGLPKYVAAAEVELDRRFPGWRDPSRRRGPTPTKVMFRGESMSFNTAKEAYIWLIEHFICAHQKPFEIINWETLFIAKSDWNIKKRLYFARTPEQLFYGSDNKEELVGNPNNYVKLSNGWYANLNLSNELKHLILRKFSCVAGWSKGRDWMWHVMDGLNLMSDEEEKKMMDEILGLGASHAI